MPEHRESETQDVFSIQEGGAEDASLGRSSRGWPGAGSGGDNALGMRPAMPLSQSLAMGNHTVLRTCRSACILQGRKQGATGRGDAVPEGKAMRGGWPTPI